MNRKRIAVIGGGAAGLAAAVAASLNADVTVYERNDRVGKKLLQTGNGRCNILNTNENNYHSQNLDIVNEVFSNFPVSRVMNFFERLGLMLRIENDAKVYPLCNQASAVLDVLRVSAAEQGVRFACGCMCTEIVKKNNIFRLRFDNGTTEDADAVILACGGCAAPKTGSDGNGYKLAKRLGHTVTALRPVLVPIKSSSAIPRSLKGIRAKAAVALLKDGRKIAEESGEIQFADYGISGIAVMQLSRWLNDKDEFEMRIDFAQQYSYEHILYLLEQARKRPREVQDLLLGIVAKRVGQQIIKSVTDISLGAQVSEISDKTLRKIASAVKGLRIGVSGTLPWDNAQVTSGGVPLGEIFAHSFESKRCSGLYIAGEMLDCDGACGGYNLRWAWTSGIMAACAAAGIGQEELCLE